MNVEKNKKTFNYLFTLFVQMGEKKLGRRLTSTEIKQLVPIIASKCENLDKKDIVREIYNLELAKNEAQYGHLGIKDRLDLKSHIAQITNCPIKLTSSSNDLADAVASKFTRIEQHDEKKYASIRPPKFSPEERLNLKNSYLNGTFHYKAPLNTSEKIKRASALGLVGLLAISFSAGVHQCSSSKSEPSTSIEQTTSVLSVTPKTYLEDTIKKDYMYSGNPLLSHFKHTFINEFNSTTNSPLSCGLKIRSVPHTFVYELENKNGDTFYITKGNSPGTTEDLVKKAGYSCKRIGSEFYDDFNVISVVTDSGNFIAGYAELDGKALPICADGGQFSNHAPSSKELSSGYSALINQNNVKDSNLLIELCSTGAFDAVCQENTSDYVNCLTEYIEKHKNSALAKEISSAIGKTTSIPTISEKADDGLEMDF